MFFAAGPLATAACGCPATDYSFDRTLRLDLNSSDPAVQDAIAAAIGSDLGQSCDALCSQPQTGTGSETLVGCERGELDGDAAVVCHVHGHDDCGGVGRVPPGLMPAPSLPVRGDVRGEYLARAARLEAAAVHAFVLLGRELHLHGAPPELVAAAERAAVEELGHARAVASLARRFGVQPELPELRDRLEPRALLDVALDNATEGCVRETLGALVAAHQARHAADPEVRHALGHVAVEELSHAELSWRIAEWFESVASREDRSRVRAARDALLRELAAAPTPAPDARLQHDLGLPSAETRRALTRDLCDMVLS